MKCMFSNKECQQCDSSDCERSYNHFMERKHSASTEAAVDRAYEKALRQQEY